MNIEEKVVTALKDKKMLLTTAESCTGGMIAASVVNVSGASNVFHQGYITYCDEAKNSILGVKKETLDKYKAVSPQVACEMALGALKISGADIAVSVTGVAGPSTEDGKPVGLVYIGVASAVKTDYAEEEVSDISGLSDEAGMQKHSVMLYKSEAAYALVKENMFTGDRSTIRNKACAEALALICEDRKSTRLNSSHRSQSRMPSSA